MSTPAPIIPSPLCQMLEGVSQPKVERLIGIFQANWTDPESIKGNLISLYPYNDNKSDEAYRFINFLQTHEISVLGGADTKHLLSGGNTKNFLVTNTATGVSQVFGVRNKKGVLSDLSKEIRQELERDRLISTTWVQKNSQEHERYSLFVTDYFPSGSLNKCYDRKTLTHSERYQQCSENIQKMIIGFQGLEKRGVLFPDAKVTNWMIGSEGNLIIADTKSLVTIEQISKSKTNVGLIATSGYIPPEINKIIPPEQEINIEKVHAFILGANLYDYLTGKEPPKIILPEHFTQPIFEGIIGKQYKDLIVNLTQTEPLSRMSLNQAMKELKFINLLVKASATRGVNVQEIVDHKTQILKVFPGIFDERNALKRIVQIVDGLKGREAKPDLKGTYYDYGKEGEKGRIHRFGKVDPEHFRNLKADYKNLKGDHLKSEILKDFKEQIEMISDIKDLEALKIELKSKPEYEVLEKSQGLFTRDGHTSSVHAFDQMFKEQKDNILEKAKVMTRPH